MNKADKDFHETISIAMKILNEIRYALEQDKLKEIDEDNRINIDSTAVQDKENEIAINIGIGSYEIIVSENKNGRLTKFFDDGNTYACHLEGRPGALGKRKCQKCQGTGYR